jgi:tRNA(Arg) A34 adenosine deaminase TadA
MSPHVALEKALSNLDMRFQLALGQAWESFGRSGLPVGALVSRNAEIISAGRNRVYDAVGGNDRLQRTPLAHAEMNAIASAPEDAELDHCEIWTTQAPCSMCTAAIEFTGIAHVHYLASDPSSPDDGTGFVSSGRSDDIWIVAANMLFLHNIASVGGRSNPVIKRSDRVEPGIVSLALRLVDNQTLIRAAAAGSEVMDALALVWPDIEAIQAQRV